MSMVLKFIVYQVNKGLAPSTITSSLSAVSFVHKVANKPDPTQHFIVRKLLIGAAKLSPRTDIRLPVLIPELKKLLASTSNVTASMYHSVMLKAMYLLAFHAFLRPGEFTVRGTTSPHLIHLKNIQFLPSRSKCTAMSLAFHTFKHSQAQKPFTLRIPAKPKNSLCPVLALINYLAIRPSQPGPLFMFQDLSPIPRSFFSSHLSKSLVWSGLDPKSYKPHSFRIGAATEAAQQGVPEHKIRLMGRWHSDAYKRYIRVHML